MRVKLVVPLAAVGSVATTVRVFRLPAPHEGRTQVPGAVNYRVWPWAIDAVVGAATKVANVLEQTNAGADMRASATLPAVVIEPQRKNTRLN